VLLATNVQRNWSEEMGAGEGSSGRKLISDVDLVKWSKARSPLMLLELKSPNLLLTHRPCGRTRHGFFSNVNDSVLSDEEVLLVRRAIALKNTNEIQSAIFCATVLPEAASVLPPILLHATLEINIQQWPNT